MEYRILDKKNPPSEVLNLSLKDNQKGFLDPLNIILKQYSNIDEWKVLSIHLDDQRKTTVGFAVIGYFAPDEGWIDDIMIDQKYQGKGYGTQAMQDLIEYLYANYNIDHIYLSCFKENINALRLYQKLGFVVTEKKDINGEIILIYHK